MKVPVTLIPIKSAELVGWSLVIGQMVLGHWSGGLVLAFPQIADEAIDQFLRLCCLVVDWLELFLRHIASIQGDV